MLGEAANSQLWWVWHWTEGVYRYTRTRTSVIVPVDYSALARGIEVSESHSTIAESQASNSSIEKEAFTYMASTHEEMARRFEQQAHNNNNKRCQLCICCMLCRVRFHRVLHWISGLWLLLYYSCYILPYHLYSISPVSCSYLIIPWVFPVWYHLLSIYLLLYVCVHNTIFNACLWFEFIDTRVLI